MNRLLTPILDIDSIVDTTSPGIHDSAAFATQNGIVAVFSLSDTDPTPLLVIRTQPNILYFSSVALANKRYLLTVYSGGQQAWVIDADTGYSTVMNFEADLTARSIICHPITAAFCCTMSKLFFVGDVTGTVFVREMVALDSGIGMKLIKRADALDGCLRVTWIFFDPFIRLLLIGDASGTVRTVENIGPSYTIDSRREKGESADCTPTVSPQLVSQDEETEIRKNVVYDDSASYQDGDDIIRL